MQRNLASGFDDSFRRHLAVEQRRAAPLHPVAQQRVGRGQEAEILVSDISISRHQFTILGLPDGEGADLTVSPQSRNVVLVNGHPQPAGATLRLRPGDVLTLTLVNRMAAETNLHFHGTNVSPRDNSDNVFTHVHPGAAFTYRVAFPANHHPGLFWYHPHMHPTTAEQVGRGMAGALIVRA